MTELFAEGTVVIVDDDEGIRDSLANLMNAAGFSVRCHASGECMLERKPPAGPACILLDLRMPGASGIEVQRQLGARGYDIPVIFLTGHAEVHAAVDALKAGATDFIVKSELSPAELLAQVRSCLNRHADILEGRRKTSDLRERLQQLTRRELDVAVLAAGGMTNQLIGMELGISERTVEVHRGRAMKKLDLRVAAELARLQDDLLKYSQNIDANHDATARGMVE